MNDGKRTGLIYENLIIALDVLRAHKLRSGLIVLGVAIGVASLMGMVSILVGLQDSITKDISHSDQTVLEVQKFDIFVGGFDESMLHRKSITDENAQAIREQCTATLRHVSFIVEPAGAPPTLRYKDQKSRMVQVIGTQPALLYIQSLDLEEGRMFTDEELLHRARVVVLGHSPRRDLFPNADPIGKKVRIANDDFTVVGTFAERKTLFGSLGENFAMIPYTTYNATMWTERDTQLVVAAVKEGVPLDVAKDDIIRVMRQQRKLKADKTNDFAVTSSDAALEFISNVTAPIAMVLAAISSIALLVGGIGVMNMMLVSVTERTGEIGIRKAVGAKRQDILWQFLIEAGVLTGIGGVCGVTLGLSSAYGVSLLTGLPFSLSPIYIVLAVIFSISIGMFFGLYPAHRASKLQPISAIGYAK
ncbi:MAG: ABC transporter permease [Acidobacteriota bacterium]|jgi:putative ABC transport system permease protein